jgi:hypothetical protein
MNIKEKNRTNRFWLTGQIAAAFIILVILNLIGCATAPELTREQEAYMEEAMAMPLVFTVPTGEADQAWKRAHSFVERFSSLKLQQISNNAIRTYNPNEFSTAFGYYVKKTLLGENVRFSIQCFCGTLSASATDASFQNAHILAYYMKTGKLDASLVTR